MAIDVQTAFFLAAVEIVAFSPAQATIFLSLVATEVNLTGPISHWLANPNVQALVHYGNENVIQLRLWLLAAVDRL